MIFAFAAILPFVASVLAVQPGASGKLSSLDGGLEGTVMVINNTALMIDDYQLKEATAPALYWWGSTSSKLSDGFRINNERIDKPSSTMNIEIPLDAGKTAADFSVVGLWCEKLHANFGQTTLMGGGASSSGTLTPSSSATTTASSSTTTSMSSGKSSAADRIGPTNIAIVAAMNLVAAFIWYLS